MMRSSSGMTPIRGTARISWTSETDIMSFACTIPGRRRLTINIIRGMPYASSRPTTRSASRTAAISGVVTKIASLAAVIEFWKPISMPAGESMITYSNFSTRAPTMRFIWSPVTSSFVRFWAAGKRDSPLTRLSLTSACSRRASPPSTSEIVYTTRFSRPSKRSRFLNPKSASRTATCLPRRAKAIPRFAVVVVLPTPPFPEVTTMTRHLFCVRPTELFEFNSATVASAGWVTLTVTLGFSERRAIGEKPS
mmetsp:Transcript_32377/g.52355  ORF Transcript_32377/g.52355 Transcript_32377/m.52355 type:complete len:251 (+) Transcript_32377:649-1401(+)